MLISHNIAVYRKRAGMSQEDLAERLHVSRQTVSKWETGQSAPDPETVVQLARLFGITTDRLLTEEAPAPFPEAPPSPAEAPPVTKAPLLDAHVLGRYVFLGILFLGGVLLLFIQLLCALGALVRGLVRSSGLATDRTAVGGSPAGGGDRVRYGQVP